MARGLLMGTVSGLAFVALALGVASLLAPQPAGNRPPESPATELAPGPDSPQPADRAPESAAPSGDGGEAGAMPAAPLAAEGGGLPLADTSPAAVPEVSRGDALAAPPGTGTPPAPVASADGPVVQGVPAPAPQLPAAEAAVALSTEPAARPAPLAPALDVPAESGAVPDMPAAAAGAAPPVAAASPIPAPDAAAQDAPAADTGSAAPPDVADAAAPPVAAAPEPAPEPAPEIASDVAPQPGAGEGAPLPPPADADAPPPEGGAEGGAEGEPDGLPGQPAAALPGAGDALPGGDTGVRVNRPGLAAPEADSAAAPAAPAGDDRPARLRFAADFADPGGLPHLAIIVIDDGSMAAGPTILSSIPFPVTVAIDPTREGAAAAMADYRAAGIEVAALAALPAGARATDVPVNLQAAFATLPETVALVDPGTGGLAADAGLVAAALAPLAEDGRGLVWLEGGGPDQLSGLAAEAGVPGVAMLRDLDGAGQDAATIRRFIDNAAFQARRDGSVVLLARLLPETVSALTLWGTANRARDVTMAPLSAVLDGL